MSVRVQIRGRNTNIDISLESTVIQLKEIISGRNGVPKEQIILTFKDQNLQNDQRLSNYGLDSESSIVSQTLTEAYEGQSEENNKLRQKASDDRNKTQEGQIQIERLQNQVNDSHLRMKDQDEKFRSQNQENKNLTTQLEQSKIVSTRRENELTELKSQLQELQGNSKVQESQKKQLKEFMDEAKNGRMENEQLQKLVDEYKSKVQNLTLEQDKLELENNEFKKTQKSGKEEFDELKQRNQTNNIEIDQLQNRVSQSASKILSLDQKILKLKKKLEDEQTEFKDFKKLQAQRDIEITETFMKASQNQQESLLQKYSVENIQKEKERLKEQVSTLEQSLQKNKDEVSSQKDEIRKSKYKVKEFEDSQKLGVKNVTDLKQEKERLKTQIKSLEENLQTFQNQKQIEDIQRIKDKFGPSQQDSINLQDINYNQKQEDEQEQKIRRQEIQIEHLESERMKLKNELDDAQFELRNQQNGGDNVMASDHESSLQKKIIIDLNEIIQNLNSELQAKQLALEDSYSNISKYKKESFESGKKLKELEESIDNLKNSIKEKNKKYKDLERQITKLQGEIDGSKWQEDFYKTQMNLLKVNLKSSNPSEASAVEKQLVEYERLQREQNLKKQKEKDDQDEKDQAIAERNQLLIVEKDEMTNKLLQEKEKRIKQGKYIKEQMMNSHGKIEVCFLVDVTASMDTFKEQVMMCIDQSMSAIKDKTNRDALWAAVAYQDFDELKKLGGLYKQIDFQADGKQVQSFLKEIQCAGGGDVAEDIRGGMVQMVQKLTWSKTFKIAMLICDAPTHGNKYNGGVSDKHPKQDIRDAIEMLIEKNIFLVGILFNKDTSQMFEQIKEIYKEKEHEELLLYSNLEQTTQGKIWEELVDLISQASQNATYTKFSGTRSKNPSKKNQSQDGAMEALIKKELNLKQFDKEPGIELVETQFKVYRVEIKQQSFESNIENIESLSIKRDFDVNKEGGQWNCIRTKKPFALGQMKAVYLMKKQNSEEVYVVKMPLGEHTYKSLDDAIMECRSHLVSKCLMKKFIDDLRVARDAKDPSIKFVEPQYSDFLILQESEESFWIAERYFDGAFVKYNNNFGFISDDDNQINHLAQAFSYYTFFVSNYNYMVSDVQGVGLYFTDPAVNTKKGTYDETDFGVDGQSMFVVAYTGKKQQIGKVFLDLLGIIIEDDKKLSDS